ncbi:hypothetical protein ACQSE7_02665 [Salmonella enterica]|nr:hypothetical protein [Salmonella enterica]
MAALCRHKNVQILKFRLYLYIHHTGRGEAVYLLQQPESVKNLDTRGNDEAKAIAIKEPVLL